MGQRLAKLQDKDRIKIYKRVNLRELRVAPLLKDMNKYRNPILKTIPISSNFWTNYSGVNLFDSEIDATKNNLFGFGEITLEYLIFQPLVISPRHTFKDAVVGLTKEQYDFCFL